MRVGLVVTMRMVMRRAVIIRMVMPVFVIVFVKVIMRAGVRMRMMARLFGCLMAGVQLAGRVAVGDAGLSIAPALAL